MTKNSKTNETVSHKCLPISPSKASFGDLIAYRLVTPLWDNGTTNMAAIPSKPIRLWITRE